MGYLLPVIIKILDLGMESIGWSLVKFQKQPSVSLEELTATRFLWTVQILELKLDPILHKCDDPSIHLLD